MKTRRISPISISLFCVATVATICFYSYVGTVHPSEDVADGQMTTGSEEEPEATFAYEMYQQRKRTWMDENGHIPANALTQALGEWGQAYDITICFSV